MTDQMTQREVIDHAYKYFDKVLMEVKDFDYASANELLNKASKKLKKTPKYKKLQTEYDDMVKKVVKVQNFALSILTEIGHDQQYDSLKRYAKMFDADENYTDGIMVV